METLVSMIGIVIAILAAVSGKKNKEKNGKGKSHPNQMKQQARPNQMKQQTHPNQMKQQAHPNQQARPAQEVSSKKTARPVRQRPADLRPAADPASNGKRIMPNSDAREEWQVARDEEIENTDLLRNVEKLMITGYETEMKFDRDFIGEGVEMLNRLSVVENIVPLDPEKAINAK